MMFELGDNFVNKLFPVFRQTLGIVEEEKHRDDTCLFELCNIAFPLVQFRIESGTRAGITAAEIPLMLILRPVKLLFNNNSVHTAGVSAVAEVFRYRNNLFFAQLSTYSTRSNYSRWESSPVHRGRREQFLCCNPCLRFYSLPRLSCRI
jgi:hypothetical protein